MIRFFTLCVVCIGITTATALELEFSLDSLDANGLPSAITKAVNSAYDLNKRGLEALDRNEYEAAASYFDEALQILPEYSDAINNKGVIAFRRGLVGDAQHIWEALAKRDPHYSVVVYNLGLIALHEQSLEAALRYFKQAVKLQSSFVEALVRAGTTSFELGKQQEGIGFLQKAYKIAPDNPDTWSFLAYELIASGDTAAAVTLLRKRENTATACRFLGILENNRKNPEKAIAYLNRAVTLGADASILVEVASAQNESGNCKGALATLDNYFSRAIPFLADAYLTGGIAAKECGQIEKAESYFEQGVSQFPSDPILSYNLGQVLFNQKKYARAEAVWSELNDSVQDPSLYYFRALSARKSNDLPHARSLIEKALQLDNRAEYHDFLGVVLHQLHDDTAAAVQFTKALAIDPELRSAQLNRALLARSGEDLSAVTHGMEQQLAQCKGDSCVQIAYQLAIVYYHQKNIPKAIAVLNSIKESDKTEKIYRHLALFYREQQEWNKAIGVLEKALERLVLEPQTEYELAELYLLAGKHAKAVERFEALLPKWHENPWRLYYQMGYAEMEQNNLAQAQRCFEKSLQSKKENVAASGLLAFVLNRQGDVAGARKLWEKNIKDDPSNPALWINMGLSLQKDHRYQEALFHYQKAAQLKPDDKEIKINLGNAYSMLHEYTNAINAYSQALDSPKRELAAYNLFLVALKKKERTRAEAMLGLLEKEFATSPYARRVRAEMDLWNGDTTHAQQQLTLLKEKEPADWLSLAHIAATQGKADAARAFLSEVPTDADWVTERRAVEAEIAFRGGDFAKALSLLKSAGDTSFAAQYNIALTAYRAGQYAEAATIAQRLSRTAAGVDRADVCRLAGNATFALKRWVDARQWYLQLSNVEAQNAIVQYNLAVASYNIGQVQDAWKYYKRAQGLDASLYNKDIEARYQQQAGSSEKDTALLDSTDIWYNKAVSEQEQGLDSAAEKLYLQVVGKNPLYSLAWNNLGAIYGKRGDIDRAEKAYFKAIEKRHDVPETYANLINLYIELEEFGKARQWTVKGSGHNPESELLAHFKEKITAAEDSVRIRTSKQSAPK